MNSKILSGVKNYTPHDIVLLDSAGNKTVIKSSGIARVSTNRTVVGDIFGFDLTKEFLGDVTGLPNQQQGIFLVVSRVVKSALPNRTDLVCPDTGNAHRNDKGHIVGVFGFVV